jgi:hypothetical protein
MIGVGVEDAVALGGTCVCVPVGSIGMRLSAGKTPQAVKVRKNIRKMKRYLFIIVSWQGNVTFPLKTSSLL